MTDTNSTSPEPKEIQLTNGGVCIVDACDYDFLNQWAWRRSDKGYAIRTVTIDGKQYKRSLHRIVADCPDGVLVDHKNRTRLDCRRENLRYANTHQNAANRSPVKNRKYRGVYPRGDKFDARINIKKKLISLGTFDSDADAARAFDKAALDYRGEFAVLNFPLSENARSLESRQSTSLSTITLTT